MQTSAAKSDSRYRKYYRCENFSILFMFSRKIFRVVDETARIVFSLIIQKMFLLLMFVSSEWFRQITKMRK